MEKDEIKEVLDATDEMTAHGIGDLWGPKKQKCCCPYIVFYKIRTKCLTINNGACPEWEFCED